MEKIKILVPTDFSESAANALEYATHFARSLNADITLLHTWEISYPFTEIPIPAEYISEQIHAAELNSIVRMKPLCYKVNSAGVYCDQVNRQGTLNEVAGEVVREQHMDLIIMGTEGAHGLKEVFMGSNAARLALNVKCPVIVVPEKARFRGLKKITYATNYESSDIEALKVVADLARLAGAHITLLHIADEHYSHEGAKAIIRLFSEKVQKKVHYPGISYRLIYGNDVEEQLDTYVKQKYADLFIMSTSHRSFFDRFFGTSLTRKMAYHTRIPLMVFHRTGHDVIFI